MRCAAAAVVHEPVEVIGHTPPRMKAENCRFGPATPAPTATTARQPCNKFQVGHRKQRQLSRTCRCRMRSGAAVWIHVLAVQQHAVYVPLQCARQIPRRLRMVVQNWLNPIRPFQRVGFKFRDRRFPLGRIRLSGCQEMHWFSRVSSLMSGPIASQRALSASSTKSSCALAWGVSVSGGRLGATSQPDDRQHQRGDSKQDGQHDAARQQATSTTRRGRSRRRPEVRGGLRYVAGPARRRSATPRRRAAKPRWIGRASVIPPA